MNNLYEILKALSVKCTTTRKLDDIFKEVFDEKDRVKLFRYRALSIEQLNELVEILEARGYDIESNQKTCISDMCKALSYDCAIQEAGNIRGLVSTAHIATLKGLVQLYGKDRDYSDEAENLYTYKKELQELMLKDDTLNDKQKEILSEICSEVDNLKFESKISQTLAIQKFLKSIYLKALFYKDELSSIKNQAIKEKLVQIYKKVSLLDKVMNLGFSILEKISYFSLLKI